MDRKKQKETPYIDALIKYINEKNVVFDVPGHHEGEIKTDLNRVFSSKLYRGDVNCPRGLDNIGNPTGVIKKAQDLMADATGALACKFLVNGSTSGNLIMILSSLKAKEKIILPRNVHKSVINSLILSGAIPVFLMPEIDSRSEIVNQVSFEKWKIAIDDNPDAKAIFVINPTYFGATADLKKIIAYAHKKGMIALVDEAHGSHFYFGKGFPITAMKAGADMSTLSIHKTGGSLTQSSVLLIGSDRISMYDINKSYGMLTSTSPSSVLLASLDAARKFLVTKGKKHLENTCELAEFARNEIKNIRGFIPRGREHFLEHGAYDYDNTKVVVELDKLTINGFELYKILHDKYHIQIELAETYVFLLIVSIGSTRKDIEILLSALREISAKYYDDSITYEDRHYMKNFPAMLVRPRVAFHAPLKIVKLQEAVNEISKDMIMIYPPGIPLIVPGEVFTEEIIKQIEYYKSLDTTILSDYTDGRVSIIDKDAWNYLDHDKDDE